MKMRAKRKVAGFEAVEKWPAPEGRWLDALVRARAYEIFLERDGEAGDPMADWLRAEREVQARFQILPAAQAA